MDSMRRSRLTNQSQSNDSFIISDSEEEVDSSSKKNRLSSYRNIIRDSDAESEDSENVDSNTSDSDQGKSDDQSIDSEEEDLNFMNNSHKISIIEDSTDSESESVEERRVAVNKLKRRSIYDKPITVTPNEKSSPVHSHLHKRVKKVIYSDSESEDNLSLNRRKGSANKSQTSKVVHESDEDYENSNQMQVQNSLEISNSSFSSNNELNYDSDTANKENEPESKQQKNSNHNQLSRNFNESLIEVQENDLTDTEIKSNDSRGKTNNRSLKEADEIVISSTSDSEVDNEAIMLAKKEIGVGNIDPIEAQKKEHLLINIDFVQKQLDKLKKFAVSVDIDKLPDKGAKVHESIEENKKKLQMLKAKLAKLSEKTRISILEKPQTPKPKIDVKMKESLISPLDEKKFDRRSSFGNKKDKKEFDSQDDKQFFKHPSEIDIRKIPNLPQNSFDVAELGTKALATLNKQQTLTQARLEHLHGSLTSRPTEDQREKDPSGLKIPLMAHQQHALAWMKWREKQKPKGGILADDMGLGKTLTMISLVLATVNDQKSSDSSDDSSDDGWLSRNKNKRYYGGTLVVCPASLIKQWESEVKNRVKRGLLSVLVFHGNNRSVDDRKLSKFNIVITTYQTLVREADSETGMYKMEWNRVILDEAHYIRNHKSKACLAVCGLNMKHKWALTGTPIQNKEMDLYAILKFLKCSPFDDLLVWKRWIDNKSDVGKQKLAVIMKTIMLRRTKQELQKKGSLKSLPDKNLEVIEIEMDRDETLVYQKILLFSQNLFAQFLSQRAEKLHMREMNAGKYDRPSLSSYGSKTQFTKAQKILLDHHSNIEAHEILVLLLRLRQMCCHPALIHAMLDKHDAEVNGIEEEEDVSEDLLKKLHNMSLNEEDGIEEHVANYQIDEKIASNLLTKKNPVFHNDRCSSKTRAIVKTIKKILEKGDKAIVVSQWTSFLKIVAKNLDEIDDANYAMFTGEVAVKHRQAIVDKLNDPNEEINILLLSLTAGGVGLNLVGANHLLLIDIHWNPQLEAQAQDRIYRFGQNKSVYVYKFICKDTIEERVSNLQNRKLEIAHHVLTGTKSVSSKLTIEDLKLLFS